MSPRIPALRPRKIIRTFQNAGYVLDHIEGSHHYFTHPIDPFVHFSVAYHTRDMKRSTLAKTLERARISLEDFLRYDP